MASLSNSLISPRHLVLLYGAFVEKNSSVNKNKIKSMTIRRNSYEPNIKMESIVLKKVFKFKYLVIVVRNCGHII